ncbi:ABC transporter ATP-binding protein [Natronosporangium hydrolyticum]|uniref:ABC transporter ATP-binding protein n=1 Tax=Natronosporangium hydrolyticum TaxID=2811111 RepID=A0A895YKY1_9ACTN|nr:ABC transporter ATP-binding protein [Natronosporangium hydrolyticum]QSB16662.1 ABC transporter ATP-binding protein [Natronosporangium hydrolyticum]
MLRTLYRILPPAAAGQLAALTAWLAAAAVLHGIALGLVGIVVTASLDSGSSATPWLVALGTVALGFVIVQWVAQMTAFRVGSGTARALHLRLGDHLAQLPLSWFNPTRQAGIIDTATTGVPQLMSFPAILLRPALTALVTPAAAALTLALLDWRFTLAVLAATALAWYVSRYASRLAGVIDARRHRTSGEATNRVLEYASRQPLIRTDQRPDDASALHSALEGVRRASLRSAGTVIPGLLLFGLTLNILFAGLIAFGIARVTGESLTVPGFVGVIVVVARLTAIAAAGAELAAGLRLQHGILTRLAGILDTPPLPRISEVPAGPSVESPGGGAVLVHADRVSFGYDHTPVLAEVSFTLPRRGLTALVGPSGSGKTTLVRLLARFWDPTSGRILLDGVDLRTLDPDQLAGGIATVLQDDYLLDSTIGENIRLGRPEASEAELAAAAGAAGLDTTIAGLPDGLDSPTGPGGAQLSGGQRQRVCIARALLKAAPLTLLDEATSALDPENTRLISAAARRLATTGSVLVIAHNLDTITHADQILVLDQGRIVQRGTHAALTAQPGRYQDLVRDHAGSSP